MNTKDYLAKYAVAVLFIILYIMIAFIGFGDYFGKICVKSATVVFAQFFIKFAAPVISIASMFLKNLKLRNGIIGILMIACVVLIWIMPGAWCAELIFEIDIPATAEDPVVLSSGDEPVLHLHEKNVITVNVYNQDFVGEVSGILVCMRNPGEATPILNLESGPKEIPLDYYARFTFSVQKYDVADKFKSNCTLTFSDTAKPPHEVSEKITVSVV